MQVGKVSYGFGTSRLWHDPDYTLERPVQLLRVERAIEQELPTQAHFEPRQYRDPFLALEDEYDVAFAQMARGLEGRDFLHGTRREIAFDQAVRVQSVLRSQNRSSEPLREDEATLRYDAVRKEEALPPVGQVSASSSTKTAGQAEAEKAAPQVRGQNNVTDILSNIGGAVTLTAASTLQASAVQGASQAAQTATALQNMTATGAAAVGQVTQAQERSRLDEASAAEANAKRVPRRPLASDMDEELLAVEATPAADQDEEV